MNHWLVKSKIDRKKRTSVQASILKIDKVKKTKASSLSSGDWYFQVWSQKVVRSLKFEPEKFADKAKYFEELDFIGVYILKETIKNNTKTDKKQYSLF